MQMVYFNFLIFCYVIDPFLWIFSCFVPVPHALAVRGDFVRHAHGRWLHARRLSLLQAVPVVFSPLRILFYGRIPKNYDFKGIEVMEFKSTSFRGRKKEGE